MIKYTAQVLNPNMASINSIKEPFEYALKMVNAPNQESVLQALGSLPQWKEAKRIVEGSGEIVGWDLETIGDVANQIIKYDGYAGITEFGIGSYVYENGKVVSSKSKTTSFAFGIDKNQKDAIDKLIGNFEKHGWDSLNKQEQVTLDRISKVGSARTFYDVFGQRNDTILGDKSYWTVKELGQSSMNPRVMRKGAERLHRLYNVHGVRA